MNEGINGTKQLFNNHETKKRSAEKTDCILLFSCI